jgi:hypothetical protein
MLTIGTRLLAFTTLLLALPLSAQDTSKTQKPKKPTLEDAKTPSECSRAVSDAWDARYKAFREKTKDSKPTSAERSAAFNAMDSAQVVDAKQCAARFDIMKIDREMLPDLATLYGTAKAPDLLMKAMDRYVETAPADQRALSMAKAVQKLVPSYSDTARDRLGAAEKYAAQIDKLDGNADDARLLAHAAFSSIYGFGWARDPEKLRAHGEKAIAASKVMKYNMTTKTDSMQYMSAIANAYGMVASYHLSQNDFTKATESYRDAVAAMKAHFVDTSRYGSIARAEQDAKRYGMVGGAAPPIYAQHWLGPTGQRDTLDFRNKITLLEFTTTW